MTVMRIDTIRPVHSLPSQHSTLVPQSYPQSAPAMVASDSVCSAMIVHHGRSPHDSTGSRDLSHLPVVVHVTTLAHCHPALWYAATQAHHRQVPLVVVHAWKPNPRGGMSLDQAAAVVSDSRDLCRAIAPTITVEGRLLQADVHSVLEQQSRCAQLLVMAIQARPQLSTVTDHSPASPQHTDRLLPQGMRRAVRGAHCPVAVAWMSRSAPHTLHPQVEWHQRAGTSTPLMPRTWIN